ncbi:MAG TPA: hypothetical protein VMR18_01070 [Candidatus Saccharimonadales bacterium]|nr:hypothetical protein [Candidatus Saccharimonadales bacterium]
MGDRILDFLALALGWFPAVYCCKKQTKKGGSPMKWIVGVGVLVGVVAGLYAWVVWTLTTAEERELEARSGGLTNGW